MTHYPDPSSRSAALYERACAVLPGGNSRQTLYSPPYPVYISAAKGSRVTDADGVERVDFLNNHTVLIHGHAHPDVIAAVAAQLPLGTCYAGPTEAEIELAELICQRRRKNVPARRRKDAPRASTVVCPRSPSP